MSENQENITVDSQEVVPSVEEQTQEEPVQEQTQEELVQEQTQEEPVQEQTQEESVQKFHKNKYKKNQYKNKHKEEPAQEQTQEEQVQEQTQEEQTQKEPVQEQTQEEPVQQATVEPVQQATVEPVQEQSQGSSLNNIIEVVKENVDIITVPDTLQNIEININNILSNVDNKLEQKHRGVINKLYITLKDQIIEDVKGKSVGDLDFSFWMGVLVNVMIEVEKNYTEKGITKKDLVIETITLIIRSDLLFEDKEKTLQKIILE